MTALDRLREIRTARRKLAAFADVFDFGSTRKDGETWETNGFHFKREGGKTRRVAAPKSAPVSAPVPTPATPADDEDEYEYSVNPKYGKSLPRDIISTATGAAIGGAAGGPVGAVIGGGIGLAGSKVAQIRARRHARKLLAALPPGSVAPEPKSMPSRWRARVRRAAMEYWPKIASIPTMLPGLLGTAGLGVLGTLGGTPAAIMLGSIGAGGLLNKAMDRGAKKAKAVRLAMAKSPAEKRRAVQRNKDAYFSELRNLTAEFITAFAEYESFAWKQGPRGGKYWLPDGKQDVPANRLYGPKAEKAANAGRAQAAKPGGEKKGPRPGEAEKIARAKFEVARDAVAAASQPGANVPADRLAWLKARMDSAEREMRTPAAPVASAPLSSLPAVGGRAEPTPAPVSRQAKEKDAETAHEIRTLKNAEQYARERAAMAWTDKERERWGKIADWNAAKRAERETPQPAAPPKTVRADPYTVLRQPRGSVNGSPIVAVNPQKGAKPVPAGEKKTTLPDGSVIQYGRDDVKYDSWYSDPMKRYAKDYTVPELMEKLGIKSGEASTAAASHLRAIEKTGSMQGNSSARASARNVVAAAGQEKIYLRGALEIHTLFPEHAKGKSPGGTPDVRALAKSVDAAITGPSRSASWGYDFTKARETLKSATKEIDDFARTQPRKVAALAREVTGQEPTSTEHAVKLLKDFVAESVDLLDKSARGGRSHQMSERVGGLVVFLDWLASRLA